MGTDQSRNDIFVLIGKIDFGKKKRFYLYAKKNPTEY